LNNAFRVSSPKSFADSHEVPVLNERVIVKTVRFRLFLVATVVTTLFLCVPVEATPELENQDRAFSLVIEGYGEVQSAFIENDYQARLEAAESMANPAARRHACDLAKRERDLRLGKLKRQLTEMAVVYHYSRQLDERDTGGSVREKVDPTGAARSLRRFILIGAGTVQAGGETNTPESIVAIRRPLWKP
jgi:hypothetical protein